MAILLSFEGYDLDYAGELIVSVNENVIGEYPTETNPVNNNVWYSPPFVVDISAFVKDGVNTIKFSPNPNQYSMLVRNITVTDNGTTLFSDSAEHEVQSDYTPFTEHIATFNIGEVQQAKFPLILLALIIFVALIAIVGGEKR